MKVKFKIQIYIAFKMYHIKGSTTCSWDPEFVPSFTWWEKIVNKKLLKIFVVGIFDKIVWDWDPNKSLDTEFFTNTEELSCSLFCWIYLGCFYSPRKVTFDFGTFFKVIKLLSLKWRERSVLYGNRKSVTWTPFIFFWLNLGNKKNEKNIWKVGNSKQLSNYMKNVTGIKLASLKKLNLTKMRTSPKQIESTSIVSCSQGFSYLKDLGSQHFYQNSPWFHYCQWFGIG